MDSGTSFEGAEMRKAKLWVSGVVTALALAVVTPAGAVDKADFMLETAGNLAALCGAPDDVAAIHMCQGFLVGFDRTTQAVSASLGIDVYCLPKDGTVTRDSAAHDFSAWVKATPGKTEMPAREGLLEWARQSYPCHE